MHDLLVQEEDSEITREVSRNLYEEFGKHVDVVYEDTRKGFGNDSNVPSSSRLEALHEMNMSPLNIKCTSLEMNRYG